MTADITLILGTCVFYIFSLFLLPVLPVQSKLLELRTVYYCVFWYLPRDTDISSFIKM